MNTSECFVKLLILGDSGVGKSCILMRFVQDRYIQAFYNTIGVDFKTKQMTINNRKCKLQIWDTAGQQRFRTITSNYYKGANGIMLVFDVTNQLSFKNLQFWLSQIQKNGANNVQKILIGNKTDLISDRVISQEKAEIFAKKYDLNYVEVSACNAKNINMIFQAVVKNILIVKQGNSSEHKQKQQINSNLKQTKLNTKDNQSKSNSCC